MALMTDPGVEDTLFPSDRTSLGRELNQEAKEGFRALFHWAVFPYPLAVIPLAWGAQLPVFGFVFGSAALAVLAVWAIRAYGAWGDRAWPFVAQVWEALFERALTIASRGTLREYRFAGERAAHEEQARETTISLGLMAQAAADDPTQVRMASDIEHGAEARLTVLLGKPQLSLAEKRERDAIQRHLQARRAGFDTAPAVAPAPRPMGFASFAAPSLPLGWIVAALAIIAALVQTIRVDRVKDEAADNAAFREGNRQVAEQWRENAQGWRDHARRLEADGTATAGVLAEREAAIARARANERRTRREMENIARDTPPAWFDSVRPPGADEVGRGAADSGAGAGSDHPG